MAIDAGDPQTNKHTSMTLTERRCPRCGCHLLESVEHDAEWCSLIGCSYGIDAHRWLGQGKD